jgi:tetratricopeptide (TPR) repeat protein
MYGGRSLCQAKTGNFVGAASDAVTSVNYLRKVVDTDSTIIAAYLGIGAYNYYVKQCFAWLPFMGTKEERALQELTIAASAEYPYGFGAYHSLAWIYVDQKQYRKADEIVDRVLKQFPDNTIFLRIKARILLADGYDDNAEDCAQKLVTISGNRNPVNWSDLLSGYQVIAAVQEKQHREDELTKTIHIALSLNVPESAKQIVYVQRHINKLKAAEQRLLSHKSLKSN